jgi:type 1 glutamine amidotransferase/glucose/arabinose dehydrogenase
MSRRKFSWFLASLVFLFCALSCAAFAAAQPKKIVLIAGPITGHPKEAHEYEKNVILLKHLLDTSPDLQGKVRVEAHFHGWPADPSTLDDADTIFLTSDGTDREEKNHPLYVGDHLQVIERQMKRGCGLVFFHWSTFSPMRVHDQITDWVGGHFDYETGNAPNHWYSAIQTWHAESKPGTPDHPVLRGVKPFTAQEEYYYRIRFRENDPRLKPIIVTRPPKETNDFTVGWAVERADGGRGFGFTGGHFYANWWNPDFRKLILNAIVWSAKLDVPKDGVRSEPFERFKALILTGHNHPAHDWRATTAALILALEQDPRAIVHVTENIEDLATDKINGYDLLVLNYCNWDQPGLSEAGRKNFVRYLQNGGGLAVVHFANGAWHPSLSNTKPDDSWPEYYTKICRRVWEHRPPNASGHDAYGAFHVEIADVKHPIITGLQPFDTTDELYFHQQGELPIEPLAYAASKTTKQREPMAWAYHYEKARVFQTVLGHGDESIRRAAALIRRGSVWAAGQNELSFDPPWQLTEVALFREGSPWTPQESPKRAAAVSPANKLASASSAQAQVGRAVPGAPPAKASSVFGAPLLQVAAAVVPTRTTQPAGTPAIAGREPGTQDEKDWVDNRWSRTDVGQFVASTLQVPNGTVTKALSIRIGDHDEASVCFDTANLNLRAGWTGGFLKFDSARFGLLHPPKIDGKVQFVAPDGPGWNGATGRFNGFHVHGKRVILEYKIGDTMVRESPKAEPVANRTAFIRTIEVGPHETPFEFRFGPVRNNSSIHEDESDLGGRAEPPIHRLRALSTNATETTIIYLQGQLGKDLKAAGDNSVSVSLDASRKPVRLWWAIWNGPADRISEADNWAKTHAPPDELADLIKPATAHWLPALETAGHVAPDTGPLAIDTLTVPYDNPWNALMFLSGVDFTKDGAAYVCSIHGDVWKVTGIDDQLHKLTWQRFATGLYQPLGLKVVNDQVYVLGRDQITRLRDENGDGEADFYENFCNLIQTSPDRHQYVTSLETDSRGNFYYVDPFGAHLVTPNGRAMETIATGFRNPNGMGVSPDGSIVTVAPQQGEWTPSSAIVEAKHGGYYGYGGPKVTPDRPLGYDPVLCWVPHGVDNSSGGEVWVPEGHWDALAGHFLHFSWGRCMMMLVLREVVDGVPQAATVALPGRFLSGAMRGAFNPRDGHLYVVGSTGWQTSALKDGSLQRVRYTGKPLDVPVAWHAHTNGISLTFTQPLDKETAQDTGSYGVEQWNYRYAAQYGSKDWSVANPNKEGHDTLEVRSAKLLADGQTVFLEIPNLKPVMQLQVQYNLNAKEGASMRGKIYATINRLGTSF